MNDVMGTVYLLHFDGQIGDSSRPIARAQHYVGWYLDPSRLNYHRNGTSGVHIVLAFFRAGYPFTVARTRPGTKADERRIKNAGGQTRYCPVCSSKPRNGVWGNGVH